MAALRKAFLTGANLPVATWAQVMLRVKNQEASKKFYGETLGLTLLDYLVFDKWKFSLFFYASLPPTMQYDIKPGTEEAHKFLWKYPGLTLELTYNHGTEKQADVNYHPGNTERDGFSHIGIAVPDVGSALQKFASLEYKVDKEAQAVYDPDGYLVKLFPRQSLGEAEEKNQYLLCQAGLKVLNGEKSVDFYSKLLNMTLVHSSTTNSAEGKVSNYCLATLPSTVSTSFDTTETETIEKLYRENVPVLELSQVSNDLVAEKDFAYRSGNKEPFRGFGHLGYLVDDVYDFCANLEAKGTDFHKKPDDGTMKGIAFALDPNGYWLEIIKRGQTGEF